MKRPNWIRGLGDRRRPNGPRGAWFSSSPFRNVVVAAVALCAAWAGAFHPLDNWLQATRFALLSHHPTGRVVFVEIDSESLRAIGVWPWPRTVHAEIVDKLMSLGAREAIFDVDFSSESRPFNDAAFAAALERAGGRVGLAAFEQADGAGGKAVPNRPIPILARASRLVDVDVPIDADGVVRDYWYELPVDGVAVPTVATRIAGRPPRAKQPFGIDYGVNLDEIDVVSVADVLAGAVAPERIRGRDIIIGASAQELRDFFMAPRFGLIPGGALHVLAAETVLQGLAMHDWPFPVLAMLVLGLALLAGASELGLGRRWGLATILFAATAIEAVALFQQHFEAERAPTACAQFALLGFALVGLVDDLRQRRALHLQAARERDIVRAMLGRVVADNFDGVVVVDAAGKMIAASRLARETLGRDLEDADALGSLPPELADPLNAALRAGPNPGGPATTSGEATLDGDKLLEFVITVSAVEGVRERRVACLTFRDITERRAHEARLDYLANHDKLTGAWTRGRLTEKIGEFLAHPDLGGLTLFCLDLRRFVLVNDVFGHEVGDLLLRAVATRLGDEGYPMVTRLGGDSYAFARLGEPESDALHAWGRRIVERICEPYAIANQTIIIGASLGATTTAISPRDPEMLLTNASVAQAIAKRRVGNVFQVYSPDMDVLRREKQAIDAELRDAIVNGSLKLEYQPKVELTTGRFIGAEALMRWRSSDGASVSPAKFVPIAEESGLIVELGRWALRHACAEARAWPANTSVAVNVSPIQFGLADVFEDVRAALEITGLPPERLQIEITESIFVDRDSQISQTLERLRAIGVSVALDDFGTGYSSLHYLGRLPIDTIKIDQSFVRRLACDASADATIQAIVSLARAHGKSLVAEGVETIEQAAALGAMGCEFGQGYYYSRPRNSRSLNARLAESFFFGRITGAPNKRAERGEEPSRSPPPLVA